MSGFFPALGDAVARFRWVVLALWIVFVGVSFIGVRGVKEELVSGGIVVPGSESDRGSAILESEFDRRPTRAVAALFTSSKYIYTDPQFADSVKRALDEAQAVPGVNRILSVYNTGVTRFVSEDKRTTYAVINLDGTEEEAKALVPKIREAMRKPPTDLDHMYLMGFPAVSYDISEGSEHDLVTAEKFSLGPTLLLLLVVFGSIIAAGLPIFLGLAAVATALAVLYVVAQQTEVSIFAMNTATMIGLGLGIDFSLLMVSRYREELDRGLNPHQATVRTVATAGQSIVFSGLTVMLGLSVMLLYDLVLVRSIALGMLLVAGLAVFGAVTLLPALLCLFGRNVNAFNLFFWQKTRRATTHGQGRWHAWSLTVMRYPWVFLFLSLAVLIGMGIPAKDLNPIGAGGALGVGKEAESREGFEALTQSFPVGEVSPISIVVRTPRSGDAFDPTIREGIWKLTKQLEADGRVARVESAANLRPDLTLEQFKQITPEMLTQDPSVRPFIASFVNIDRGRDTYLISVISSHPELSKETVDLVKHIREDVVKNMRELAGTDIMVTGQTALSLDYRDELFGQFPMLVGLVLLVTYFVLLLFFHSLLLPLKAILMNLVGIVASYGFMVMVFEWGILDEVLDFDSLGQLTMFPPVILFSILFGLSTDYEVFLLSRVKELYRKKVRQGDPLANEHSVAEGLERTAGIITAAGLIMIVVFGAFAVGNVLVIKEIGVGLAMAVLLDSTIIRVILVPASMKLMGGINWWMPRWLSWFPEFSEGGEEDEEHLPRRRAAQDGGYRPCPTCGVQLPARARFCGRCGTSLVTPHPALVAAAAGPHETLVTSAYGGGRQGVPAPPPMVNRAQAAGLSAGGAGLRRMPIILQVGNVQRRAWLNLRDCQVEKDPSTPSVPVVAVAGLEVLPLPGQDPPEIQVRNARVRF